MGPLEPWTSFTRPALRVRAIALLCPRITQTAHCLRAAARSRCLFISLAKDGERDPEKLCNAALRILCRQVTHRTRVDASERRVGNGTWPQSPPRHRTAVCYPFGEAGPPTRGSSDGGGGPLSASTWQAGVLSNHQEQGAIPERGYDDRTGSSQAWFSGSRHLFAGCGGCAPCTA